MKSFVFILLLMTVALEGALSQPGILERKVKIDIAMGPVGKILDELEKKGGFIFSYGEDIRRNESIILSQTYQSVQQFLDEIFLGEILAVEYGNKLIIMKKPRLPEVYTIRGKVIDSGSREPLAGVHVYIPGTAFGSASDRSGYFEINVPLGVDMVRLSAIGYESTTWERGQSRNPVIAMNPENYLIEEATIVYPEKPLDKADNISVSYLDADILENVPVPTIDHILQGTASGVLVTRNSGMPGASLQVKIRGNRSLINSDPIYYLDGIPIQQSTLHAVSPNDIESVEVLKDASATAEYGARAGNGVIYMTTRKGTAEKPAVSLNYHFGQQQVAKTPDLMDGDELLDYLKIVFPNSQLYEEWDSIVNSTDWMQLAFHKATTENLYFSASGGNKRSAVYTSAGYYRQSSIIKEMSLKRYSFRVNSEHTIHPDWKLGQDLAFAFVNYNGLKEGHFLNDHNNPILSSMLMSPWDPPNDSTTLPSFFGGAQMLNPNDDAELTNNSRKNYIILGNFHTSFAISPQLKFRTRIGLELNYQDNVSFRRYMQTQPLGPDNPLIGTEYTVLDLAFDWQNRLEYSTVLQGTHTLKVAAGYEYGQSNNRWIPVTQVLYNKNMNVINPSSVPLTSLPGPLSTERDYIYHSLLGYIHYSFREKYYLDLSLRRDRIGYFYEYTLQELSGIFPSFSMGWIVTEENFFPEVDFLHYGKIRYGWGQAANSPRMDYSYYAGMMLHHDYVYAFNSGGGITSTPLRRHTCERFYWENTRAHNLGMDFSLFRNRLFISIDYFHNLLQKGKKYPVDKPLIFVGELYWKSKFGIVELPASEMVNKGMEFNVSYKQAGRRMNWEMNIHFTHLRNEIIDIEENYLDKLNDPLVDFIVLNLPGQTAGSFYGWKIERLFKVEDCDKPGGMATNQPFIIDNGEIQYAQPRASDGDYKYVDINQDGIIDKKDKTILGNPYPDFTAGLYSNLQFMNFDLSMLLQGVYGNEIFNATKLFLYSPYATSNKTKDIERSYRSPEYNEEGEQINPGYTDTDLHRFGSLSNNMNLRVSDFYIEDGSYLRIKNIQLGYTVKPELTRKIYVEKARVFICVQNLWTLTSYSGLDPEVGGWGIDCGIYPQPRTYMAGVNISF